MSVTEPAGPFESQYVFDLSHGHSLRWHRSLLHKKNGAGTIPKVNEDLCRGRLRKEPAADRRLIPRDVGHRFREGSKKWPTPSRN
ncbi:MAG: hypothetical protein OJF47_003346 [Nitrospira sp.]|nr:MAG: hypothetical protein OJF47_003346 [Nitrospira sp.]